MRRDNHSKQRVSVSEAVTPAFSQAQAIQFTGDVETDAALLRECLNLSVLRDALTGLPVHHQHTTGLDLTQSA